MLSSRGAEQVDRLWADAARRQEEFARDFAGRVRLPYQVTEEAFSPPFLLRDLWTDGTFTYLRTEGQEIPAVYVWRGDASEVVHTDVEPGGLLVVEQVIRHGTLSLGGREAWFGLAAEGGAMPQRRPGFFERNFATPPRMYGVWPAIGAVVALLRRGEVTPCGLDWCLRCSSLWPSAGEGQVAQGSLRAGVRGGVVLAEVVTRVGFETTVVLPRAWNVVERRLGDPGRWVVTGGGHLTMVRPLVRGAATNLALGPVGRVRRVGRAAGERSVRGPYRRAPGRGRRGRGARRGGGVR